MGNNKSKRSRSSSGKSSSSSSFKPGDIFGGSGGGLVPVFAIVCGVLIGMGGAYVVKRVIFGNKKRADVAMVEESDRTSGRSKLKREARIRPVETAEITEPSIQHVEQPPMQAVEQATLPPMVPTPEPRVLPKSDPLPPEPVAKHVGKKHVAAPSKAPIRVTPPPKTVAMVEPSASAPDLMPDEPKQAPKFMTIRNLTYSRQLFNRCAEDCLLLFRAADGGAVKAKLKKSSFMRVLSNNLAYADIDGYESLVDGERVIVVKSIRGMPVPTAPPAAPKHDVSKSAEKVAETPKAEKKKDKAAEAANRRKNGGEDAGEDGGDAVSMRNRLEGASKAKKKDDNGEEQSGDGEEEEGSTFQNRLKKSLD